MAFDKPTRNRLAKFVADARGVIADEFTEQFQSLYGISAKGDIAPLDKLGHLDEAGTVTAALLRERIGYLERTHPDDMDGTKAAVARLAREQAFTILNRLAAIRMAEMRGLIVESVGKGYQSKGFKVFETVAGSALGDTYHRYRRYLFCLFDELAIDLGALFDRRSPQALLFPREPALLALLDLFHASDLEPLWAEDETIGWIYQFYNDPEERKKMRKESAAPRNSRELAVRNQFFTPRYVVEFLTDNTLGRIWYEMTKGQTRLAEQCRYLVRRPTEIFLAEVETVPEKPDQEGLSQEELLKQPVHIPHRPLKDPREIRLLDPACGSMHFGLYAFDLFETIYEEAWDNGFCPALQDAYPSKDEFLKDVPRLIIEHNIHGIDIDPRATQIAALSLWLRAQKAWQQQKVPAADRPRVRRSNIVCAEPMPGSPEMLVEFVATLDPPLLGELVKTVFDKMQLAGEAGSLLKIEEEIRTAIDTARKEWLKQQKDLLTRKDGSQEEFFATAEQQVIDALRAYAEQADADSYQRRLFADDAARGFAFIDLSRKRYDVVVMNPPFGAPPQGSEIQKLIKKGYPQYKKNLACAFVFMAQRMSLDASRTGVICDRSLFFRKNYKPLRLQLLAGDNMEFMDLGWDVMDDANVEAAAFTCSLRPTSSQGDAVFFDLRSSENREDTLRLRLDSQFRRLRLPSLRDFPNAAFAHWVVPSLIDTFHRYSPSSEEQFLASNGMSACDSPRFLRLWWEVPPTESGWKPLAHGGKFAPFIRPLYFTVNWQRNGSEIKHYIVQRYPYLNGDPGWVLKNEQLFFEPGLTYGKRAMVLSAQAMPSGAIFSDEGQAAFPSHGADRLLVLGFLNSRICRYLINCYCGQHKHSGYLNILPWCITSEPLQRRVEANVREGIELRLRWERIFDHGHRDYLSAGGFAGSLSKLARERISSRVEDELRFLGSWIDIQTEIEAKAGLAEADREEYLRACGGDPSDEHFPLSTSISNLEDQSDDEDESGSEDEEESDTGLVMLSPSHYGFAAELATSCGVELKRLQAMIDGGELDSSLAGSFVAQALDEFIGTALGRWDIRYATGERQQPELPDPFDPLPVCPPGMLQNAEGLPAEPNDVPADYPLRISWPGILVDDENHSEDIIARVREAIEVIWKDRAEAIEQETCGILGVNTLREYFRRPAAFFADHLKRYSKSRRQAPIYWPLSTKSGSYTLWLYYHRLTDQTLHTCLADFLDPKLRKVQSELDALTGSGGGGTRAGELREFLDELKDLRDEIERVIKLPWKPNLNDGVLITASPLHKIFRLPKWQKDLKACWEKLAKGDYDWSHLAYTIWPSRVEKACEKDRSIAIAHGLEHLCKVEPPKPKKQRSKKAAEEDAEEESELIEGD
jgi:hypothetical protein